MSVHPWYLSPEASAELRRQYVSLCDDQPVDLLVAVPSDAGPLVATILGAQPRRVLLILTAGEDGAVEPRVLRAADSLRAWAEGRGISVACTPPEADGRGVPRPGMLAELVIHPDFRWARRIVYLATGGRKEHTTVLARQGEVTGQRVLLVHAPKLDNCDFDAPKTRLVLDTPPREVVEHHALASARRAVLDRRYDAALALLRAIPAPPGPEVSALECWTVAWQRRDAMDFQGAAAEARRAQEAAERGPQRDSLRDIARKAGELEHLCKRLGDQATTSRLLLILEVAWRATCERRAGRTHLAALLYYRAIEATLGERLRGAWSVDDSADGPHIISPIEGLTVTIPDAVPGEVERICRQLGAPRVDLDRKLALLDKYVLLVALQDPLLPAEPIELGRRLKEASAARNRSLFAHGFAPTSTSQVDILAEILGLEGEQPAPRQGHGLLSLLLPRSAASREVKQGWKDVQGPHLNA